MKILKAGDLVSVLIPCTEDCRGADCTSCGGTKKNKVLRCKVHRKYQGIRVPRVHCPACKALWTLRCNIVARRKRRICDELKKDIPLTHGVCQTCFNLLAINHICRVITALGR